MITTFLTTATSSVLRTASRACSQILIKNPNAMTTLPTAAFITLSGAAVVCAYTARTIMCSERHDAQMRNLADERPDCLLNELVVEDASLLVERLRFIENGVDLVEVDAETTEDDGGDAKDDSPKGSKTNKVVQEFSEYDHSPIEVKLHRRVHKKSSYSQLVIAQLKNRFGHLKRDGANDKAVRRAALKIFELHGVRPDHIERMLDNVIIAVFVPSKYQLHAEDLITSREAMRRMAAMERSRWFGGTLAAQNSC